MINVAPLRTNACSSLWANVLYLIVGNGEIPFVATVEIYTPERIAEFLLSNAIDADDYADAVQEVRKLGFDPEKVLHHKPSTG